MLAIIATGNLTSITEDWMDGDLEMNQIKASGCPPVRLRQGSVYLVCLDLALLLNQLGQPVSESEKSEESESKKMKIYIVHLNYPPTS